jgi:hypothetical protein
MDENNDINIKISEIPKIEKGKSNKQEINTIIGKMNDTFGVVDYSSERVKKVINPSQLRHFKYKIQERKNKNNFVEFYQYSLDFDGEIGKIWTDNRLLATYRGIKDSELLKDFLYKDYQLFEWDFDNNNYHESDVW